MENNKLLELYSRRYSQELEKLSVYAENLEYASMNEGKYGSNNENYQYFLNKLGEVYNRIDELKELLQDSNELIRRGQADDLLVSEKNDESFSKVGRK